MINLYNDDCLKKMQDIPDKTIDMILCDLPYGTTSCRWDTVIDFELLWDQYKRIIKKNGAIVLFGQEPFSSRLRMSNIKMYKYDWIWKKSNPSNIAQANKQPMRYHELISVFYQKQPKYNKQMIPRSKNGSRAMTWQQKSGKPFVNRTSNQTGLKYIEVDAHKYNPSLKNPSSVLEFDSLRPTSNEFVSWHATQKPVNLLEHLIKTYTDPKELILDNCMGSGSTGIACMNLKRRFIGIELDTDIFLKARKRLEEHKTQLQLPL